MFPAVFIIHDFEEIIMFRPWLDKNSNELKIRFPKFHSFLLTKHYKYSTSAFAVGVLFIFLVVATVTFLSLYFDSFQWWFGAFMAFFIHLFVHIAQWIIYRKYVPVIITSILVLPYCIYTFFSFWASSLLSGNEMWIWTFVGIILTILCFPIAFFFASRFEKWKNNRFLIPS